jgi:hypothetical protein
MSSALELYDSRVSHIALAHGSAVIHFSHAYIHRSKRTPGRDPGSGWSQEAELVLGDATLSGPLPPLPNTIAEGALEVGGIRHELIPIPFKRKVAARLHLTFADGTAIEIVGQRPFLELLGKPIYLENFS